MYEYRLLFAGNVNNSPKNCLRVFIKTNFVVLMKSTSCSSIYIKIKKAWLLSSNTQREVKRTIFLSYQDTHKKIYCWEVNMIRAGDK